MALKKKLCHPEPCYWLCFGYLLFNHHIPKCKEFICSQSVNWTATCCSSVSHCKSPLDVNWFGAVLELVDLTEVFTQTHKQADLIRALTKIGHVLWKKFVVKQNTEFLGSI